MQTAMQYREFAQECDQLARQTKSERHRNMLEDMARVWRALAEEADKAERKRPEKPR